MDGVNYVNVFRDNTGKIHYSTEEFSVGQEGIFSVDEAVSDACQFTVLGEWHYLYTLTRNNAVTHEVRQCLHELEQEEAIRGL